MCLQLSIKKPAFLNLPYSEHSTFASLYKISVPIPANHPEKIPRYFPRN